jgi:hypothetical protein
VQTFACKINPVPPNRKRDFAVYTSFRGRYASAPDAQTAGASDCDSTIRQWKSRVENNGQWANFTPRSFELTN